jgi:hypothetical protein
MLKGVYIHDDFWDQYAQKLNEYNLMVIRNYQDGKITLAEKSKAHANIDEFFADFYLQSAQLIK